MLERQPEQPQDGQHMAHALALALRGLGRTAPNPAVGCVLVRDGVVVGRGHTQDGGRPHAEIVALAQAGAAARGATAYVTLEPCAHEGQTGPCADALAAAGVVRVVTAMEDPDPRVDGGGIARLRAAGIAVTQGVQSREAEALQIGYLHRIKRGRPAVTLKIASSLDGKVASATGASQWITGPEARQHGHMLRANHDAIMIGSGTALADQPSLTCRLPGLADRNPIRILLDRTGRVAVDGPLFDDAAPTWLFSHKAPDHLPRHCRHFAMSEDDGIDVVLSLLAAEGLTRLLVEGGARLQRSFWTADLFDRVEWYRSPNVIGGDGKPAVSGLNVSEISDSARLRRLAFRQLGDDLLESLIKIH